MTPLNPKLLPHSRLTYPTRSLMQGGPYTPAARTDIRALFARVEKPAPVAVLPPPLRVIRNAR